MPGDNNHRKPYTMREMKQIVDYLADRRLYSEVRARKMWMDFANSGQIQRTWQSLKETFLKRILPDIHNPYYKLSVQQISSFKQEYDVDSKNKAKLEIHTISDSSSNNGDSKKDAEMPSTSKSKGDSKTSGEDKTCSKIESRTRSSTETLVLENIAGNGSEEESETEETQKSIRDCITYSEPLTPMLQEVLDDFATDDEEPRLQIVEEPEVLPDSNTHHDKSEKKKSKSPVEIRQSRSLVTAKEAKDTPKSLEERLVTGAGEDKSKQPSKTISLKLKKTQKGTWEAKESTGSERNNNESQSVFGEEIYNSQETIAKENSKNCEKATEKECTYNSHETYVKEISENCGKAIVNCSNSTADTFIPNNQEALVTNITAKQTSRDGSSEFQSLENKDGPQKKRPNRKRSSSEVSVGPQNKQKKDNGQTLQKSDLSPVKDTSEITVASIKSIQFSTESSQKDINTTEKNVKKTNNHDDQQQTSEYIKTSDVIENTSENQNVNSQEAGPSNIANETQDPSDINPCLKSVSLFAEQFSSAKYSDQESDIEHLTPNKVQNSEEKSQKIANAKESELNEKFKQVDTQEQSVKFDTQEKLDEIEVKEKTNENAAVTDEKSPNKLDTQEKSDEMVKAITNEKADVTDEESESKQDYYNTKINNTDVVVLKSHSESSLDDHQLPKVKRTNGHFIPRAQRDMALANVFGFTSGGAPRKRKLSHRDRPSRRYQQRRRTSSRHSSSIASMDSGSSDYSTLSDSDDHDSRRRQDGKFFQPKPYAIITNPTDGTLFVVHHKKVYPLVKKYKNSQHLLKSLREIDSEEKDSYWKKKYMEEKQKVAEEKIRADELARLLKRVSTRLELNDGSKSPILQAKPSFKHNEQKQTNENNNIINLADQDEIKVQDKNNDAPSVVSEQSTKEQQGSTVKIKFTKDNEIELECQWPHVQPVLEKMAQMFHKNGETSVDKKPQIVKSSSIKAKKTKPTISLPTAQTITKMEIDSSGSTTPICLTPVDQGNVQQDVHDKVNKLESEIFREIEEKDKSEREETATASETNIKNIVPRGKRGKLQKPSSPRKSASPSKTSTNGSTTDLSVKNPAKKCKHSNEEGCEVSNKEESKILNRESKISNEENKISNKEESEISNKEENKILNKEETNISNEEETNISNKEETKISNEEETEISNKEESKISNEEESKISNKEESKISNEEAQEAEVLNLLQQTLPQVQSETESIGRRTRQSASKIEAQSDTESFLTKRQTRVPKKLVDAYVNKDARRKTSRSRSTSNVTNKLQVEIPDDSQVLYKFPKSTPATRSNSRGRKVTNKEQKPSRNYKKKTPKVFSSPDSSSIHSVESTLGYQDSDVSLSSINSLRRKKKLGVPTGLLRGRRRKSCPYLADDDTFETSIHREHAAMNTIARQNSSVDYRSESYQLLMPKITSYFGQLDKINESSPLNEIETINTNSILSPLSVVVDNIHLTLAEVNNSNSFKTEDNSSNVSLPPSPELSVVENMSVSKELLSSLEDHPTINEIQCNDEAQTQADYNKYLISDLDAQVPLMEQNCELRKTLNTRNSGDNIKNTISESLLSQICDGDIDKQLSSDSIDEKLKNLILESAKKLAQQMQPQIIEEADDNAMEIDVTQSKGEKKTRAKKRCSTPVRKKKYAENKNLKLKFPNIGPVVEERMEFCSRGGRQSCPPVINIISCDGAAITDVDHVDDKVKLNTDNRKGRKKKDVIKVKITRPKDKNAAKEELKQEAKRARSSSRRSVCNDSGINDPESELFIQGSDDSVELIHNHSETCINANECIGDSVEFVENQSKLIISLDSSSSGNRTRDQTNNNSKECHNHELFCNDAQQATSLNAVKLTRIDSGSSTSATVYHTPPSHDSLITEDLSDNEEISSQPQSKVSIGKWYLLSEEETSNTNLPNAFFKESQSVGANLNQIFPLTCAVPNLSTITESDGDSRRQTLNCEMGNTENEFTANSQSN